MIDQETGNFSKKICKREGKKAKYQDHNIRYYV